MSNINRDKLFTIIAGLFGVYQLIILSRVFTWFGYYIPKQIHLSISLLMALILVFILNRGGKKQDTAIPWYDYLLMLFAMIGAGFVILFNDKVLEISNYGYLQTGEIVLALLLVIPILEAVRRRTGIILSLLILFFLIIVMFQGFLPGILSGQGYGLDRLLYSGYVGTNGIFGLPLNVAAGILMAFLIFGSFLQKAGAGKWFMDLSTSLTGWSRGGPAKAAVIASALFGSISGSPSANTATTGAFTIPLMKSVGYRPAFAGAVEAVASTGGQVLPPVMGAIAFVMAEWIGVPYADIVKAAFIPAVLYFVLVFFAVHFQAYRDNVKILPFSQLPNIFKVIKEGWFYSIPMLALIYFLLGAKFQPDLAAVLSIPFVIGISFLSKNKEYWMMPKNIWDGIVSAVKSWITIGVVTGAVGLMIGALELSGLGIKFSDFILAVSGEKLFLTLVLVGLASLLLGMGLDSIPAYITLATLLVPALISLGVPEISAHLFVIFWGLSSFITPPVCIAVFVACGISGSKIWETGWEAVKLGIAIYIVPFLFIYKPALLLNSNLLDILISISVVVIGGLAITSGVRGYGIRIMNSMERIISVIGGALFITPNIWMLFIGVALMLISLGMQTKNRKAMASV